MKIRKIKKQFNKIAKEAIKNNSFLKKYGLYDTFLFNIKLEKHYLNTTTKGVISECGNIKSYVNLIIENIEETFYNYPNTKSVFDN